ncbi:hypothetical protein KP79_PYT10640 [Mizuhopecten yessoensis]|uniref:Uncharacterized protein n=1 Tax=Mizuhopecten yessoensis TaxID=6573 RepID=A0A210QEU9_MIZYE|nr:hypothetical protein KP79_PYT10640 [Mizuhopecten yessoensis]
MNNSINWLCVGVWCMTMMVSDAQARPNFALSCDHREVRESCLYGCLGCLEVFGVQLYDMAACCHDCKVTRAVLVDDGPVRCSDKYIHESWIKRFGKRGSKFRGHGKGSLSW